MASGRSTARKRGLRVRLRCSIQCKGNVVATINAKTAKRLELGKRQTRIAMGRGHDHQARLNGGQLKKFTETITLR